MPLTSINPATGAILQSYPDMPLTDVEAIVRDADRAFAAWRRTSMADRAAIMKTLGTLLRAQVDPLARLMAQEMGKPLVPGRGEIEKCAWVCDDYVEHAAAMLAPERVATDATTSYIRFDPLGVVLAIMPWNFPFWQAFRAIVPAVMAGNAMLLKHASNVSGCALAIEAIVHKAGVPRDLFRTLLINSSQVGHVIEQPLIRGVTLTGSTPAGQSVAAKAGEVVKKTVLELGGSDPYLILEDADVASAVDACVASRLINGGQSCIAAKRFIVAESVRPRVETLMVERMRAAKMGDPLDETVTLGPMARHDLRDALHQQVVASTRRGARLLLGGTIPDSPGAYYPPTVLTNVKKGMPAYDEETFGPVAAIISVHDEDEAIRVANDSIFGLGAAVFTADVPRGERIAAELEAGCCFVNAYVRSDPRLPFGGIKQSGYGRELSAFGIREFVNIKVVYVK